MKQDALKKSQWKTVRLRPMARRFEGGPGGTELHPQLDDDWCIGLLTDEGVPIENTKL